MGCVNSSYEEEQQIENQRLYNIAVELYHQRARNYKYYVHGNYERYLYTIRAQFELDCLPNFVKYGKNYSGD
jgi:hypothetical protein